MIMNRARELRLRRWSARMRWKIIRSRARILSEEDRGEYQLINAAGDVVVGQHFDAILDDIEVALLLEQQRLRGTV